MSESSPQIAAYWHQICQQVHAKSQAQGVHLSRCVVLLPFVQLLQVARYFWSLTYPDGFVPQFQTTQTWAQQFGSFQPASHEISFDTARDILMATQMLEQSGLLNKDSTNSDSRWRKKPADVLAPRLLDAVYQLSAAFAATHPDKRLALADQLRAQQSGGVADSMSHDWLRLENGLAQVAIAWSASSRYASDVLFDIPLVKTKTDMLMLLPGVHRDALAHQLIEIWQQSSPDFASLLPSLRTAQLGQINVYQAQTVLDEAECAAACVLRHLREGRMPVALVANDRALTRRVHAMLLAQNIRIKDESGWKLSTTRAAATLMSSLAACASRASADQVLDWLKNSAFIAPKELEQLEKKMRRTGMARWQDWVQLQSTGAFNGDQSHDDATVYTNTQGIEALRVRMQGRHQLSTWLQKFRQLLQSCKLWDGLCADQAGEQILEALHLKEAAAQDFTRLEQARTRFGVADFEKWVRLALESCSFIPAYNADEGQAQVMILPLSQLLARPFAAAVIPGCDEVRVQAAPALNGPFTQAQKQMLGLPTPDEQTVEARKAWQVALATPVCDVLWRSQELSDEPLQLSSMVQSALLKTNFTSHHTLLEKQSTENTSINNTLIQNTSIETLFEQRALYPMPSRKPQPHGAALAPTRLSSSAYEKLRDCPYQYFALHMLGLAEEDELVDDIGKRDFGSWLHNVLHRFHCSLKNMKNQPVDSELTAYTAMLNIAAEEATQDSKLPPDAFLPWASVWPKLRDGYLQWLLGHQASGFQFVESEKACQRQLGGTSLQGRIDRLDSIDSINRVDCDNASIETAHKPRLMLIDYKTENDKKTKKRVEVPLEDTQLAFYGALLDSNQLRAAYVNVGERETKLIEQKQIVKIRDALLNGILQDMQRIASGAALPALGEGTACDYCGARGLCRKDFWSDAP